MFDGADTPAQEMISMSWQKVAKKYGSDFNENTQAQLKKEWDTCAEAPLFQLCLKNAVALNPALNRSDAVRKVVNNWHF